MLIPKLLRRLRKYGLCCGILWMQLVLRDHATVSEKQHYWIYWREGKQAVNAALTYYHLIKLIWRTH